QAVDRGRILQGVIGDRVVGGEAGEREQRQRAGMLADRRPVAGEMERGERQQDKERAAPADAGERQRRNVSGADAADNRIAGPEQRGKGQKKIRLIEQSPAFASARTGLYFRHECVVPWRSGPAVGRFCAERSYSGRPARTSVAGAWSPPGFADPPGNQAAIAGRLFGHGPSKNFCESNIL